MKFAIRLCPVCNRFNHIMLVKQKTMYIMDDASCEQRMSGANHEFQKWKEIKNYD